LGDIRTAGQKVTLVFMATKIFLLPYHLLCPNSEELAHKTWVFNLY